MDSFSVCDIVSSKISSIGFEVTNRVWSIDGGMDGVRYVMLGDFGVSVLDDATLWEWVTSLVLLDGPS